MKELTHWNKINYRCINWLHNHFHLLFVFYYLKNKEKRQYISKKTFPCAKSKQRQQRTIFGASVAK